MSVDILITENIQGPAVETLKQTFQVDFQPDLWQDIDGLAQRAASVRAVIVRNQTQVTAALLEHCENLRVVGRAGAGLDNIDVAAADQKQVVVVSTPEQNSVSVAELTLGLMLSLARKIPAADRSTRQGNWARQQFTGVELSGATVGIVGFGRIGFLTAMRARAMGMRVLVSDPVIGPDAATLNAADARLVSLDDLLETSDFVCCHVPCVPATRGMFDAALFGKMKRGSFFINTSRGEVVQEDALIEALRKERLAGAALDVRQVEPPASDSALNQMENVILTPHIAAFTQQGQRRVVEAVCRDVAAVLNGQTPRYPAGISRGRS